MPIAGSGSDTGPVDSSVVDERPLLLRLRLVGRLAGVDPDAGARLVSDGHATVRGERIVLSPAGRVAADAEFRAGADEHPVVANAYEHFLPRNVELIQVCHDWQVRPGNVANDHADTTYDWGVIDRLAAIDDRAGPVVRRLGRDIAAFDGYRPRLRAARTQVEEGERDWFTSPRIDSYHTVWMELHEHLLVALGIERGTEAVEAS